MQIVEEAQSRWRESVTRAKPGWLKQSELGKGW